MVFEIKNKTQCDNKKHEVFEISTYPYYSQ